MLGMRSRFLLAHQVGEKWSLETQVFSLRGDCAMRFSVWRSDVGRKGRDGCLVSVYMEVLFGLLEGLCLEKSIVYFHER